MMSQAARFSENPSSPSVAIEELSINTIRTLSIDAVQKAKSGHPGTPMALAPLIYAIWQERLRFDPEDPIWPNRDRFVLSNGHASMLLYSMFYLSGVRAVNARYERLGEPAVSLDDIKRFRQLDSKAPGHPEYHLVSGIETTTGPLGQGIANSVGMAIASRWLAAQYNRPDFEIFDYNVYAVAGDGCLMEGISHEAASLAGHLKLSNLCWFFDNNHITIDGRAEITCNDDIATRFLGYGWNVTHVGNVNDLDLIRRSLEVFRETRDRPTLVIVDSVIGYGAPKKQGTSAAHGEPLGEEEVKAAKRTYGWPENAEFFVPPGVLDHFKEGIGRRGHELREAWTQKMERYRARYPKEADEIHRMIRRELPEDWDKNIPTFPTDAKGMATRQSSQKVMNAFGQNIPWFVGGAADLVASTYTSITSDGAPTFFSPENWKGRNIHFGIREHAMGSIVNGLSLSKLRPFGSTFLIFSDYEKPPLRLAALMEIPVIQVFTHDSIGLGEDGPTHQPVEQLAALRTIPGLITLRPADANEVVEAWRVIFQLKHQPATLILTRQPVPTFDRNVCASAKGVARGAYVLLEAEGGIPDVILIGTGSEVQLCVSAREKLKMSGIRARVVSMPSWELFEQQSPEYREEVLPKRIKARVSVEQASVFGWDRYVGPDGIAIGMKTFGASAPIKDLLEYFGFTPENVVEAARKVISK